MHLGDCVGLDLPLLLRLAPGLPDGVLRLSGRGALQEILVTAVRLEEDDVGVHSRIHAR